MKCWLLLVCFVTISHIFESLLFQHVFWISRGTFTFLRNFKEHCIFPIKVVVKITFSSFWRFNCYIGYFFWVCMQFDLSMNERKNVNIKLKFYWILHNIGKGYSINVLWCQPIKLIQVVSTSEFHEYWWNDLDFIFLSPSKIKYEKISPKI